MDKSLCSYMAAFHKTLVGLTNIYNIVGDDDEDLQNHDAFTLYVNLRGGAYHHRDTVMSEIPLWNLQQMGEHFRLTMAVQHMEETGPLSWKKVLDLMVVANLTDDYAPFRDLMPHLPTWDKWIRENGGWAGMRFFVANQRNMAALAMDLS